MAVMITTQAGGDWELPEDGSYLAVLADVIFLGPVATAYGVKDKVQLKWLLDAYDTEGNQFQVSSFYNATLDERSNLRKDAKSIAGFDVGESYDIEQLLGTNNQLVIQQNVSGEKTYANVVAILKAPKGKILEIPADFERKIDKDGVGSTERPVNSAPGKKAVTAKKAAPAPAPAQRQAAAPAPAQRQAAAPARRAPAPAPAEPEYVEEVDQQDAAVEEAPAPAPVRQTRALPAQPAAVPANRAGTIRRAAPAAAPVAQAISDDDIPF